MIQIKPSHGTEKLISYPKFVEIILTSTKEVDKLRRQCKAHMLSREKVQKATKKKDNIRLKITKYD